jgi:hypothetical protein
MLISGTFVCDDPESLRVVAGFDRINRMDMMQNRWINPANHVHPVQRMPAV